MRYSLVLIVVALLISAGSAFAARCFRPAELPACTVPKEINRCYFQNTQASAQIPSCMLCHPHKFQGGNIG